jgi:hypothetical protein
MKASIRRSIQGIDTRELIKEKIDTKVSGDSVDSRDRYHEEKEVGHKSIEKRKKEKKEPTRTNRYHAALLAIASAKSNCPK